MTRSEHTEPDPANLDHWRVDPPASDEPWPQHYGRPVNDEWTMQSEIVQLEHALDAANAKLARISVALVAPPSAEEALRLIREVLEDD